MTLWRLEGAALDPADLMLDEEVDQQQRVIVVGDLDALMEVIRIPGFQLYRLEPDPPEIPSARTALES